MTLPELRQALSEASAALLQAHAARRSAARLQPLQARVNELRAAVAHAQGETARAELGRLQGSTETIARLVDGQWKWRAAEDRGKRGPWLSKHPAGIDVDEQERRHLAEVHRVVRLPHMRRRDLDPRIVHEFERLRQANRPRHKILTELTHVLDLAGVPVPDRSNLRKAFVRLGMWR